ncbi:MAG: response regulator [Desulfobacterales bacterium]|nr:MAG: response regulator [Desulfobacterales bacterium]
MEKSLRIVIVDDNPDFLFTMETFLQRNGFEVSTANDGKKGLELIRRERPDAVLLDVMMETLFSGFELCKQLRSDHDLQHTPIIGISGMGDELNIQHDQWPDYDYFRPDAFLEKPVDKQKLLSLIPEVIQKAKQRQSRPKWEKEKEEEWAQKASHLRPK